MSENELSPMATSAIKEITVDDMIDSFDKMIAGPGYTIAKTSYNKLDEIIGGYNKDELIILGCRPGMGNTTFILNQLIEVADNQKIPTAFFSLQLSKERIMERLASMKSKTSFTLENIKKLNQKRRDEIKNSIRSLSESPLFFFDSPDCMIHELHDEMVKAVKEKGIKLFFIDYLQLIQSVKKKGSIRDEEISYILRKLKKVAKEHDCCVLVSSTLSRSVETRGGDKRPMLSDLRESGSIEQIADKVCFLYRPEYYNITEDEWGNSLLGKIEIIVSKNSHGPLGTARLHYDLSTGIILNEVVLDDVDFRDLKNKRGFDAKPDDEPF